MSSRARSKLKAGNKEAASSTSSREAISLKPAQLAPDLIMKRYWASSDYPFNHLAEKMPIHQRPFGPTKRQMHPASAIGHDLNSSETPVNVMEEDRYSRQSKSAPFSPNTQKTAVFLPGDRVIFSDSPAIPGIPVVYRTPDEKASNPDRLNLDRRRLMVCPILEGEDQLKLLNCQHNLIRKIQHMGYLKKLIFLDLYNNQIEEISGLTMLKSLRVLMLGKNRIKKIQNLDNLTKLDVLDLHGNEISEIENLSHLCELRVLNLAGNEISHVDNLAGMDSLAELNLRRNQIQSLADIDSLPSLQRLFLSFNEISSFDAIACLADSHSLSEISLDGNPITMEQSYKYMILQQMQQIRLLDMKKVSEEERRIALTMSRKEEEKKREMRKIAALKEKRRIAITNAKHQWEVIQGSTIQQLGKFSKKPESYAQHVGCFPTADLQHSASHADVREEHVDSFSFSGEKLSCSESAPAISCEGQKDHSKVFSAKSRTDSRESASSKETLVFGLGDKTYINELSNLAELNMNVLTLYGLQSLEALDRNWGMQAAGAVTVVSFNFMDFDEIVKHLHKLRTRFPSVQTVIFSSTNIHSLQQLSALSIMRRLDHLKIDTTGNSVTCFSLWKMYLLFRLAHFSLKKINDVEVTATDIVHAEKLFGMLSYMITSQLPQSRLLSVLGEARKKQLLAAAEEKSRKTAESKLIDKSQEELLGRAGLVYLAAEQAQVIQRKHQAKQEYARSYISEMAKDAIYADKKCEEVAKLWPQVFQELVLNAVKELLDMETYKKQCMDKLEDQTA